MKAGTLFGAMVVCVGGLLAACGSDDSGGTSSTGGTTSTGGAGGSGGATGGQGGSTGGAGGVAGSAGSGASGGAGGSAGASGPSLGAADQPSVTPCPNVDDLTDATKFQALQSAMKNGAITYLDIPYNASDADILKKKCGLEGFWDPTKSTDSIPVTGAPKLATVLTTGNAGICSANFQNFGTDEGFPVAGVYRKEFKATESGTTYLVRTRITTSGSAVGKKFSDLSISVPSDIQSTLVYKVNGTATTHDNLWGSLLDAMSAGTPGATLDVEHQSATIFTSKIELICAAKI